MMDEWKDDGWVKGRSESRSVVSDSLQPHGLFSPWNSLGQNTGEGSLSLLQGIFPTQGSNPGLLHYMWILYQLICKESPRILEWVAYPFFRRSFLPRNWIRASCIAGRFFTKKDTPKSCNKNLQVHQIRIQMYLSPAASSLINTSSIHSETFAHGCEEFPYGYVPCLIPECLNLALHVWLTCLPHVKLDGLFSEIELAVLSSWLYFFAFVVFSAGNPLTLAPHMPGAFWVVQTLVPIFLSPRGLSSTPATPSHCHMSLFNASHPL